MHKSVKNKAPVSLGGYKYKRRLFAVDPNTIFTTDIAPEITIDHVNRLKNNILALRNVLGVTSMTALPAGSKVKIYEVKKQNNPAQVPEGEIIELTKIDRKKVAEIEMKLLKYRKLTTAEAIQQSGMMNAVYATDDKLIKSIQQDIRVRFFELITGGTGLATTEEVTADFALQNAFAAIWGELHKKFEDSDVTPVYFVNPLDVAKYLKHKAFTTTPQTFGFKYLEDFLGLGSVIIDSLVPQGKVFGTCKENLNGAYVPASGGVAQALQLSADPTSLILMKHYEENDRASVGTLALTGVVFYPEFKDGIFKADVKVKAAGGGASGP